MDFSRSPNANLLGFDLRHVARTQDGAPQTPVRDAPELIDDPSRQGRGRLATHGSGVGLSRRQADELARSMALGDVLEYADAANRAIQDWLREQLHGALEAQRDVPAHLARYPVDLEPAIREEIPLDAPAAADLALPGACRGPHERSSGSDRPAQATAVQLNLACAAPRSVHPSPIGTLRAQERGQTERSVRHGNHPGFPRARPNLVP